MLCFGLAACGKKEDPTPNPNNRIYEISNWVVGDIWNKGFVLIRYYVETGKDANGVVINISSAMDYFERAISKREGYNDFILGLTDDKYAKIKENWRKLYDEMDSLYKIYKDNPLKALDRDYPLNINQFMRFREDFTREVEVLYFAETALKPESGTKTK